MKNNERFWKIAEIVLGCAGVLLLALILVLKIMGKNVVALTYPIVGIVILFLICDEFVRSIRRRREKEETAREREMHPEEQTTDSALPKNAFEFDGEEEKTNP